MQALKECRRVLSLLIAASDNGTSSEADSAVMELANTSSGGTVTGTLRDDPYTNELWS